MKVANSGRVVGKYHSLEWLIRIKSVDINKSCAAATGEDFIDYALDTRRFADMCGRFDRRYRIAARLQRSRGEWRATRHGTGRNRQCNHANHSEADPKRSPHRLPPRNSLSPSR